MATSETEEHQEAPRVAPTLLADVRAEPWIREDLGAPRRRLVVYSGSTRNRSPLAAPEDSPKAPASPDPALAFAGTVVALGASAGGLDALDRFFAALPPQGDAAFVVIQHLAPEHRTMMDTLLARHTRMPVRVATEGLPLQGGHVYVIPPGATMTVALGRLRLVPRPTSGMTMPIDAFFDSLAAEAGARAVGIVLSGTGSDGSRGVQLLDESGAWVLAQEPESCRFDGMPRNAIATGCVDQVGTPEALAHAVVDLIASGEVRGTPEPANPWSTAGLSHDAVLRLLASALRFDFSQYKPNTVLRRVERRLHALGLGSLPAYAEHLAAHPQEADSLRQDLLIPVTSFFRDPDAFTALAELALRPLISARAAKPDEPLRVWITATATGQEAYSITMLLLELVEELAPTLRLKVFATDVEPTYLERAAAGRYADAEVGGLSPERLARFFVRAGEAHWQVRPELRQRIVFSRHDLLSDAPFTQLDLVCCRNVLIYLRPPAQDRILRRLAYGLRPGGILFMGSSESPTVVASHFHALESRLKVFRLEHRLPTLGPEDLLPDRTGLRQGLGPRGRAGSNAGARTPAHRAADLLIERYAPPAMLISVERELLHLYGNVQSLLRFRGGDASLDVLQLLPEPLMPIVATLTHAAAREGTAQRSRPVALHAPQDRPEAPPLGRIAVWPVPGESGRVEQLLVVFELPTAEPVAAVEAPELPDALLAAKHGERLEDIERELAATRANLQDTIQELGTANEELQATNEELMASNEELQSTNEELQSVNEELHTINAEYQRKIGELNDSNADLESLSRATRLPILFLDHELHLTRFTPEAAQLFNVRAGDVGRPISDISHRLDDPDLYRGLKEAFDDPRVRSRELRDGEGRHWLLTAMPFAGADAERPRLVVTCVDLSSVRDVQRLQGILDALPEHVAVLDRLGVIELVNRAWREFAERNGDLGGIASGPGTNYLEICRRAAQDDAGMARVLQGLSGVLDGSRPALIHLYPCHSRNEQRWFLMHATPAVGGGCVISHFNLTGWVDPARVQAALEP